MKLDRYFLFITLYLLSFIYVYSQDANMGNHREIIETPYVYIEIDTINLLTERECLAVIPFKGKYYAYGQNKGDNLFSFDEKGNFINSSVIPDGVDYWMLNYSIKNNQLIAVDYSRRDIAMYQLNVNSGKLKKIRNTEAPIYEDEEFIVLKTTHGEWGGMVYFLDKKSNEIYRGFSNEAINVNKFNGKYYVTTFLGHMMGHSSIYEISNPREMQQYKGRKKNIINNQAESSEKERYAMHGLKCLVDTFSMDGFDSFGMDVICSFVHKDRMLQMWNGYSSSNKFYLTEIINEKLKHRYTFPFDAQVNYLYNLGKDKHYFNFNIESKETEEDRLFGTIEIDNEKIKIHFFTSDYNKY